MPSSLSKANSLRQYASYAASAISGRNLCFLATCFFILVVTNILATDQDQELIRLLEVRQLQREHEVALQAVREFRERVERYAAWPMQHHYWQRAVLKYGVNLYALCAALNEAIRYYGDVHASGLGILHLVDTSEYILAHCSKEPSKSQDLLSACRLTEELKRLWSLDPSDKIRNEASNA